MISSLNRYSYLVTTALVMGMAWLIGARFGGPWPAVAVTGSGIGLALVQRRLRGGASDVARLDDVEAGRRLRQTLLLFLYSDT
jgi:hypothetical protein